MTAAAVEAVSRGPTLYVSLRQPWATLWVAGAKLIETRSWYTGHRGRLAVHGAKAFGEEEIAACYREPFRRVLSELGFDQPADLPRGAVIGWVTVTDCLRMVARARGCADAGQIAIGSRDSVLADERLTPVEAAFGAYADGRFAWMTNDHRLTLPAPIPMKALQRIQKLPPEIAARFAS